MKTSTLSKITELWLEILPELDSSSWQSSQSYANVHTRWRAYLNQLTLDAFLSYLESDKDFLFSVWPSAQTSAKFWELFNGSAITVGQKRLVLIPTEIFDDEELRVPQEWVDIPDLAADYYFAVQVIPDEQSLRIWSYTTHQNLKQKASYDFRDRTYSLSAKDLIKNISVFWVSYELCQQEITQEKLQQLPQIPVNQGENLVKRLGNKEVIEPRLEVPFLTWAALLQEDAWRSQLCDTRLGIETKKSVDLTRWLENIFEAGWETLEEIFPQGNLTGGYRRNNSPSGVKRAKYIEISPNHQIILQVEFFPKPNGSSQVVIKLSPQQGDRYLPANIELRLLYPNEEIIDFVRVPEGVNLIKKEINLRGGQSFSVKISLNNFVFSDLFTV